MSGLPRNSSLSKADITHYHSLQDTAGTYFSGLALLLYEFLLTAHKERHHIWAQPKSLVFFLFVSLRYLIIVRFAVLALQATFPFSNDASCAAVSWFGSVANILASTARDATFVVRVCALWPRNTPVLLLVSGLLCALTTVTVVQHVAGQSTLHGGLDARFVGCYADSVGFNLRMTVTVFLLNAVLGTLVVIMTVAKMIPHVRQASALGVQRGLSFYILRDGILYFVVKDALSVIYGAMSVVHVPNQSSIYVTFTAAFPFYSQVFGAILAQRLILNLRTIDEELRDPMHGATTLAELDFAHGSILGNIGAPLRTDSAEGAED